MARYYSKEIVKSPRIDRLKEALFAKAPEIEVERAVLLTESYKKTEGMIDRTKEIGYNKHKGFSQWDPI